MLGQTVEELGEKVARYREAFSPHPGSSPRGIVSLMLHTYVGESVESVRDMVREPMIR